METGKFEHAGEGETSVGLALFLDLVRMDKIQKAFLAEKGENEEVTNWRNGTPLGFAGDATLATGEKGGIIVNILVERLASKLKKIVGY